jgi:O-antigen/teichoic acid export membrane protein
LVVPSLEKGSPELNGRGQVSSRIGLRSTGLVNFSARIISAGTGLVFAVMVARWLVPSQLGLWEFIVTLVTFSTYPVGIVSFWATRDIARGKLIGRTAFYLGMLMSGAGLAIFSAFTAFTYSDVATTVVPFLLAALLVPLSYWSAVAGAIIQGHRPSAMGYSLVLGEVAKLAVAYPALFILRSGILGVIGALVASYFVQSLVGTYLVRDAASESLKPSEGRRWLSLASLPALSSLPGVVLVSDTFFASLGFGTAIVGIYQASYLVASVVGYSSALALSLYPLLLRGGSRTLPAKAVEFTLMFSIPMALGGIVLARPILQVFGTNYLPGSTGLAILCLTFLTLTVSGVVDMTLLGTESADAYQGVRLRELIRTNLAFVPLANLASACAYVVGLLLALWYSFAHGFSYSEGVALWTSVQLATTLAFLGVKALRARRYAELLPGRSVLYYTASGAAMGVAAYFLSELLPARGTDALAYGAQLLGVVGVAAGVYFGLLFVLDSKFRQMAASLLG